MKGRRKAPFPSIQKQRVNARGTMHDRLEGKRPITAVYFPLSPSEKKHQHSMNMGAIAANE